jgi:AcrR family transcriptional regulator
MCEGSLARENLGPAAEQASVAWRILISLIVSNSFLGARGALYFEENRRLLRFPDSITGGSSAFATMSAQTLLRPRRADAQRNRARVLSAATAAFAEEGEAVALESIAARAGVGIGTLYRHFPSREALVAAAYRNEVDALCAAAADLVGSLPADQALRAWGERFAAYIATKRAMGDALRSAAGSDSPLFAETRERILGALRLLLEAGAASGTLRSDVDPTDVMRIISGIWYLPDGPEWRADVLRMLDLVIDGLRYGVDRVSTG